MPDLARVPMARVFAAVVILGLALTLSACVSDSAGTAFGPPPTATVPPIPTTPPVPTIPPIPPDKPAAVVAGTPIMGADFAAKVEQERTAIQYQIQQQGGSMPTEQQIRSFTLNLLIQRQVESLYGQSHGLAVSSREVQARFDAIQLQLGGPYTFTNALRNFGFTPLTYMAELRASLLSGKIQQHIAPLPATVEEVQARHILVKTKALADKLYAELQRDPSKFAALAKKYSTDTGSAANGGELGLFPHGQMVAPFDRAAFAQPVGQIGKPVHSQFGYHIIQVEARRNIPFASLDQNTQTTYTNQQRARYSAWINRERAFYHVRVLFPGITATP